MEKRGVEERGAVGIKVAPNGRPQEHHLSSVGEGHKPSDPILLATKLLVPRLPSRFVPRPQLIELLEEGMSRKLTLINAPGGFGKTTALSEWADSQREEQLRVAWVELDQSDNDPALFWSYCIEALRTARPTLGETAAGLLGSLQAPSISSVVASLINEIATTDIDLALILDNYHLIELQPIHDSVAFLLDHAPPQMHLVISTRETRSCSSRRASFHVLN